MFGYEKKISKDLIWITVGENISPFKLRRADGLNIEKRYSIT